MSKASSEVGTANFTAGTLRRDVEGHLGVVGNIITFSPVLLPHNISKLLELASKQNSLLYIHKYTDFTI